MDIPILQMIETEVQGWELTMQDGGAERKLRLPGFRGCTFNPLTFFILEVVGPEGKKKLD